MSSPEEPARPRASEDRLAALKDEALRTGRVAGAGVSVAGGPIPREAGDRHAASARAAAGYYGQPILKPPVWTWQVGLYFFVGGTAGMSAVLALAALATGQPIALVQAALAVGLTGAVLSPCLLIWDLGRPARFLNMLRVFKWRSAMSMGVWTLVVFSGFVGSAFVLLTGSGFVGDRGLSPMLQRGLLFALVSGAGLSGAVLATYTGVLLGATVVPAWSSHHRLLPFHFGIVALGSAAAVLELLGFRMAALNAIGLIVSAMESGVGASIELRRGGSAPRALFEGTSGVLLRTAGLLTGPVSLLLRVLSSVPLAAACLLTGALVSRYAWISAGRASAGDLRESAGTIP